MAKPKLPKITLSGNLSEDVKSDVYLELHARGAIDRHRNFMIEGREKWGRPENFYKGSFLVSDEPFPDFPDEKTHVDLPSGKSVHIVIQDDKGQSFPYSEIQPHEQLTNVVHGMFVRRPDGRVLCYEHDGEQLTGDRPFKMDGSLAPLHRHALEKEAERNGGNPILGLDDPGAKGFIGSVVLTRHNNILEFLPDFHRLEDLSEEEQAELAGDYDFVMKEIADDEIYKAKVIDLVASQLTEKDADRLIGVSGYAKTSEIYPSSSDHERRRAFDDALFDITLKAMNALREQGLLEPCPNNGPRNDVKMNAWNNWLNGAFDDPEDDSFDTTFGRNWLSQSPAFGAMSYAILDKTMDMEDSKVNLGKMRKCLMKAFKAYAEALPTNAGVMSARDLRCEITGDGLMLVDSVLKPELTHHSRRDKFGRYIPLENLEAPKKVRHMEIPLPSGKLIVNDWFRIKGFKEGVKALIGTEDNYDINYANGLDDRARNYFTKAGLCIVQVGNSSPTAYVEPSDDGSLIYRAGYVDEDHEDFWDEKGKRIKDMPEEAFSTCTDLWANTFADEQVLVDILLASGEYEDRAAAQTALDDYVENTWTVSRVDVGFDQLHLYAQTGYGMNTSRFSDVFKADELAQNVWQEDQYILSTKPLTVDPELLEENEWVWRDQYEPPEVDENPEP